MCSCELWNSSAKDIFQIQEVAEFEGNLHLSLYRRLRLPKVAEEAGRRNTSGRRIWGTYTCLMFSSRFIQLLCVPRGSWKLNLETENWEAFCSCLGVHFVEWLCVILWHHLESALVFHVPVFFGGFGGLCVFGVIFSLFTCIWCF